MLKNIEKLKKTIKEIRKVSEDVYKELGPGFEESDYQMAMSIEFAKSKNFEALREVSVELFYKDQYLKFGELDFLIAPKKGTKGYPFPFFIETKVAKTEPSDAYDQIRRYLMSLPRNSSSAVNTIEIAVLIVFSKNSDIKKGKEIEKKGKKIVTREPSIPSMPDLDLYISCYYYDSKTKTIKPIEGIS